MPDSMSIFDCPSCDAELKKVSHEASVEQKYDYKLKTEYHYYKCDSCNKMFDQMIRSTGLRHLSVANREKAEKLAIQSIN